MKLLFQRAILIANVAAASVAASRHMQEAQGSYWAIYNVSLANATGDCLVAEGIAVAESCCLNAGESLPHAALQGNDTCFLLGPGLVPFSGCVGDGVAGYGEQCVGEGAPFVAQDAAECGCEFVIEGNGCYKANDLPGQQWFVYLDGGLCTIEDASSAFGPFGSLLLMWSICGLLFLLSS